MLRDSANMDIALQSQTAIVVGAVALSLLLTAVLYAISYTVCVRIYAKKEK